MTLISDALDVASHGWPVFPCGATKHPAIAKAEGGQGFRDATLDADQARHLFQHRQAKLIGVPTGELSGFDVLDLDYRHGAKDWEDANAHRLPETRTHETMSGGRHMLFRHVHGVRNSASKFAAGMDVRGEGGYVIVPPSAGYRVISDAEIADWPDWLLEIILARPAAKDERHASRAPLELSSKRLEGLTRSILSRVSAAPAGGKHFALRNAALSLGGILDISGMTESEAAERLLAALPEGVLDWNGARATALWGLQRGRDRPLELEDRPRTNGHATNGSEPPPDDSADPAWWRSLEQSLVDRPDIAEVMDDEEVPTSARPELDGKIIDPAREWLAQAPIREWVVEGWIPRGVVTGMYGDGGVGKSLLAQQLLTSVSCVKSWLGLNVKGGRAFGFMCEDDASELHRRQESINRAYGLTMPNLEFLRIAARFGFDNLLMTFDERNRGSPTELFAEVCKFLTKFPPTLVVLDTLADIFGGNEIMRAHARQFVQGIGGQIARQFNCAVVIAAHPSASGMSTGSGAGGSTAWSNTFRSRLYMTRPEGEGNDDVRHLSRMKANYAPKGGEIVVKWTEGAFLPVEKDPVGNQLEWSHIKALFSEIDRAWKADEAWSNAPQTRREGRYLPLWATIHLGLQERLVVHYLDRWLAGGYLKSEIIDTRTKRRGLSVVRWMQPPVAGDNSAEVC